MKHKIFVLAALILAGCSGEQSTCDRYASGVEDAARTCNVGEMNMALAGWNEFVDLSSCSFEAANKVLEALENCGLYDGEGI